MALTVAGGGGKPTSAGDDGEWCMPPPPGKVSSGFDWMIPPSSMVCSAVEVWGGCAGGKPEPIGAAPDAGDKPEASVSS